MHKLDRDSVQKPACLDDWANRDDWQPDENRWAVFGKDGSGCKRLLRLRLQAMQALQTIRDDDDDSEFYILGLRCAYCESVIHSGGHIEHFRRKSLNHTNGYPELTFEWSNLFLCCDSKQHCGHFKDRKKGDSYEPALLIKPDVDDPDRYLFFSSTGAVRVRSCSDLTQQEQCRALETIRVFNLQDRALVAKRRAVVQPISEDMSLDELMQWSPEDRAEYIALEIAARQHEPYATTIRHFFEMYLS